MKRVLLAGLLAVMLGSLPAHAAGLSVAEGVVTTEVIDRQPVDAIRTYPAVAGRLYCFTRITGAAAETSITHVWLWRGKEMRRAELPVRAGDWRTWSVMVIDPQWTGNWQVEVRDAAGKSLATIPFALH